MLRATWAAGVVVGGLLAINGGHTVGQDWPQWRGANRDAKASGFKAPAVWPKELTKKWSVPVGNGVSTPSLADGKLIVFTRQDDNEVVRCLNAATGDELWKDEYPAKAPTGGARGFPGPRASPTVVDGKVVTLGADGMLTCYDVASGRKLWQKEGKDDFDGELPMFFTSSSPIVLDGVCIAQLGGQRDGGIVAFDLTSGEEKWRWTGDGPAYGSPVSMKIGDKNLIVAPTAKKLVALDTSGKQTWEMPYSQGRYNSATPIVAGDTLIIAGPGTGITAIKFAFADGELKEEKAWSNTDNSLQFNTPVLKDGKLYGLSNSGQLFCLDTETNKTTWTAAISKPAAEAGEGERRDRAAATGDVKVRVRFAQLVQQQEEDRPRRGDREGEGEGRERGEGFRRGEGRGEGRGGFGRGGFGRGRGGRGGGGGYGSVVDAGSVLIALSPAAELVVFEPTEAEYKEVARYKVAERDTYAYPVPAGNGIYIKDADALTLWTVE